MYYFKFVIGTNADGSRITYSPGWYGVMPKCPQPTKVLIYNDKEGWGLASTEDTFVPPEVEVVEEAKVKTLVASCLSAIASDSKSDIYLAKDLIPVGLEAKVSAIEDRWLPEAQTEDIVDTPESLAAESKIANRTVVDTYNKFCPICHQLVAKIDKYEDGSIAIWQNGKKIIDRIIAKTIILVCPTGHKVNING